MTRCGWRIVLVLISAFTIAWAAGRVSGAAGIRDFRPVPSGSEVVRFSSDFEAGLQGWGANDGSYVSSGRGHSGTHSLKMADDGASAGLADCYKIFPAAGRARLEFWVFIPTGNAAPFDILLTDQAAWAASPNERFALRVMLDGALKYYANGLYKDFPVPARAAVNDWTNLVLSWDAGAEEWILFVNGADKGAGLTSKTGGAVRQVVFRSSSAVAAPVHAYFDDVRLTAVANPRSRFATNFDTGSLQGWAARDGSGVSDEYAASGTHSLKINDLLKTAGLGDCSKSFADVGYGQAFFNVYLPSGNKGPVDVLLSDRSVWSASANARFLVRIMPDGAVKYGSKGAYKDFPLKAKLKLNVWHRLRLTWQVQSDQIRLNVDEGDKGSGGSWKAGGAVKQVILRSGSASAAKVVGYFDDIKVTSF